MSLLLDGSALVGHLLAFLVGFLVCLVGVWFRRHHAASPTSSGDGGEYELEVAHMQGVRETLPGVEFQYHVGPDGEGTYQFIGKQAEAILGLPAEPDDFEERFLGRVPEGYRHRHDTCVQAARDEEDPEQVELPYERPDGERIWLLLTSVLERCTLPGRGETLVFSGIMLDITGRKRREEALRERQEKIKALYGATKRLLGAESRDEVVSEVHRVLEEVFRYPFRHTALVEADTIIPKKTTVEGTTNLPRPAPRPAHGDTVAARALDAGEAVVVSDTEALENEIEYGDLHSAAGVPIGQRGVIVVGKEEKGDFERPKLQLLEVLGGYTALVLERLRREEALRLAKEEAEIARAEAEEARDDAREAAQLKSVFLANMSHEIRTPLTSIIGFAEVLTTEISRLDVPSSSSLKQQARLIEQGGKRLLEMLEGVLHLSELEAGQMELKRRPVDLADQARRTVGEMRRKAEKKDIDLQVLLDEAPVWAEVDEGGIQIVLQNLISNAIRYTEEAGDIRVRAYSTPQVAVLEVEDTGIGMEAEMVDQLFEPFRQASEGMGREYEGSGVGLAVTQKAVEEMGGNIEVETQKGEGSTFTVRLPLAGVHDPAS